MDTDIACELGGENVYLIQESLQLSVIDNHIQLNSNGDRIIGPMRRKLKSGDIVGLSNRHGTIRIIVNGRTVKKLRG